MTEHFGKVMSRNQNEKIRAFNISFFLSEYYQECLPLGYPLIFLPILCLDTHLEKK